MNLLKARTGWDWILGGLTLFRKRPFFLTNLFFIYLISMILLSMIPFIGQISGDRLLFVNVSKYWIARLYGDLLWWGVFI